jgi:outer membrane protein OmpA-like peptidoglycan-associated protein
LRAQSITYLVGGFLTMIFMTMYLAPRATAQRRSERQVGLVDAGAADAAPRAREVATPTPSTPAASPPAQPGAPAASTTTPASAPTSPATDAAPPSDPASVPEDRQPLASRPAALPPPLLVTRFSTGSALLGAGQLEQVERAAGILLRNPELHASVRGHADARGSDMENTPLSEQRAAAVTAALLARGVEPQRLHPLGTGSQQPLDRAATASAFARNRRVEIVFTRKDPP